jgi:hypothetical protein
LRPPRPVGPYDDALEQDSLLEPGALRERFAHARRDRGQARPRRWLADLIGHARSDAAPPAAPAPLPVLAVAVPMPMPEHELPPARDHDLDRRAVALDERSHELDDRERELRGLARRDETLREREQWIANRREELQRRIEELETIERSLELREREVLRREEAAARWFTELNRMQRLIEEKRRRLELLGSPVADDEAPPQAQVAGMH